MAAPTLRTLFSRRTLSKTLSWNANLLNNSRDCRQEIPQRQICLPGNLCRKLVSFGGGENFVRSVHANGSAGHFGVFAPCANLSRSPFSSSSQRHRTSSGWCQPPVNANTNKTVATLQYFLNDFCGEMQSNQKNALYMTKSSLLKNYATRPLYLTCSCRYFRSKHQEEESEINDVSSNIDDYKYRLEQVEAGAWLLRLANENGYLSWCRNTYIATIIGATVYTQEVLAPYSKEAAVIFLLMGGVNMTIGSGIYIHNVLHLRGKILMSRATAWFTCTMTAMHLFLWVGAVAIYLGYVEEDEEDEGEQTRKRTSVVKNV